MWPARLRACVVHEIGVAFGMLAFLRADNNFRLNVRRVMFSRRSKYPPNMTSQSSTDHVRCYILENATALGSRIPPHAVLLHVNNTPVKLKIIFAI